MHASILAQLVWSCSSQKINPILTRYERINVETNPFVNGHCKTKASTDGKSLSAYFIDWKTSFANFVSNSSSLRVGIFLLSANNYLILGFPWLPTIIPDIHRCRLPPMRIGLSKYNWYMISSTFLFSASSPSPTKSSSMCLPIPILAA